MAAEWRIEALEKAHERLTFRCGQPALEHYLRELARPHGKRNTSKTYVLVRPDERRVWGYYTLSSSSIDLQALPEARRRGLPARVPAVLIGRFAIDTELQGRGLGTSLLMDALERIRITSETVGIYAVEVQAIDTRAHAFYAARGFLELVDDPLHMLLPIEVVRAALPRGGPAA